MKWMVCGSFDGFLYLYMGSTLAVTKSMKHIFLCALYFGEFSAGPCMIHVTKVVGTYAIHVAMCGVFVVCFSTLYSICFKLWVVLNF
jgi:hypothetical protein